MSTPEPASPVSATVWSSTFVPSASPFPDYGAQGYSVAWVDTATERIQVLVDGERPVPGTAGTIVTRALDGRDVEMFQADPA